ncbi:single hybrid motif-containing protein, partial [Tilletiopsis washingtonensis]
AACARARALSTSAVRARITPLVMPAMSPTMTEGGIARWALGPGDAFSAGDVILEIETDKATMDVEAPDDGVFGQVVVEAGAKNVQVGDVIAMLAEEGDDLSNIQVPTSRIFPSVARLLAESGVKGSEVKGTGVRGMLTKGDVLAHL